MSQQELADVRPGEPAPFFLVVADTEGVVHLTDLDRTLCCKSRKRIQGVTSPSWWERRCDECFGAL